MDKTVGQGVTYVTQAGPKDIPGTPLPRLLPGLPRSDTVYVCVCVCVCVGMTGVPHAYTGHAGLAPRHCFLGDRQSQ